MLCVAIANAAGQKATLDDFTITWGAEPPKPLSFREAMELIAARSGQVLTDG